MIQVESQTFKGNLLELLGKTKFEVSQGNPFPRLELEGIQAERFIWFDSALDDETGQRFMIGNMVRFLNGFAWAVGMRSDNHLFLVQEGTSNLVVKPKEVGEDPRTVNWIAKNAQQVYYNFGVSF